MTRVAVFISGGGSNMVSLLEDMARPGHAGRPCVVLSNTASAGGLAKAQAMGVTTAVVDHRPFGGDRAAFEAALDAALAPFEPDLICLAGFMRKLTAGFTDPRAGRMINIHPSLLPKYKGLHTHARALDAGDGVHGCTVHEVTAALDDGPILGQAQVPVLPGDTPDTLAARVLVQEHRLYPAVLRRFAAGDRTPLFLES
ncbi:phosphoribosylglycinamide formyltransferase [Sulfitobacter sp. S190]|uniref:phosphoribosylglycinamide formyltransferase n=1 Tax=Sulfitobacter sp. S190 TaxID=2867022 RepID=UPI0021A3CB33|nr:phosphoribosylglycinamide formyltransferase [Sulfitobacter sp. S190]UWR23862.1 phosphoribosylglycinamide formyltransferase [Sulfitobacter sp. S190]